VNGVGAGVYSATVTDAYGCAATGVVNVTQPNILLLTVNADPTICYGQQTQIYAAGRAVLRLTLIPGTRQV